MNGWRRHGPGADSYARYRHLLACLAMPQLLLVLLCEIGRSPQRPGQSRVTIEGPDVTDTFSGFVPFSENAMGDARSELLVPISRSTAPFAMPTITTCIFDRPGAGEKLRV